MRNRIQPLLCELHAHTTWSDGSLSIGELVDLYGGRGFDVLCITDHTVRSDDPWLDPTECSTSGVRRKGHASYVAEIAREAARARALYDLVVLPGLELTYNDLNVDEAAHAVAVGLTRFVSVDDGIAGAIETARAAGAAIIAAHPFDDEPWADPSRLTRRFAVDPELRSLAHRFELFNRTTLFGWVAREGLPFVANGDFHEREHLDGWKTLLPCERDPEAVVAYLRSPRPTYLTRVEAQPLLSVAA
jgi:processive 1,2-diacylglycerol beta-glucosyltransferase